jgi:hypothetical protein
MNFNRRDFMASAAALVALPHISTVLANDDRARIPSYKPPSRSAPGGRIGGGSRGAQDEIPTLLVLAPDHKGLTATDQPTVYWYLSQPTDGALLSLKIANVASGEVLLSRALTGEVTRGIHALSFTSEGIRLPAGAEYEWRVSFAAKDDPSKTMLSKGLIAYEEAKADLKRNLSKAKREDLISVYASAGYWYDAIQSVSELIDADPGDANFKLMRGALLDQVRLHDAADYDREAVG